MVQDAIQKLKEEGRGFQREVKERTIGYVLAAFGFIAGLAWNEAIKALIEYLFPLSKNTLLAKFVYAILITVIVVLATVNLMKLVKKEETNTPQT